MQLLRRISHREDWPQCLIAGLCIALILLVGAAQLLHVHDTQPTAGDTNCTWCAVAHLSASPVLPVSALPSCELVGLLPVASAVAAPACRPARRHTIRPPPLV